MASTRAKHTPKPKAPRALRAPFPYAGGKGHAAAEVWRRFGDVLEYREPFFGSGAVLLANPNPGYTSLEVVGDADFFLANFWRVAKFNPTECARWADYPVSHIDMHARRAWLTKPTRRAELRERLSDAEWPGDAQAAGFWIHILCCWIGKRACPTEGLVPGFAEGEQVSAQVPLLTTVGAGIQGASVTQTLEGQMPRSADTGSGIQTTATEGTIGAWFAALSARLARTRILHADWTRTITPTYAGRSPAPKAFAGIFLDPPYEGFDAHYAAGAGASTGLHKDVEAWCRENGSNKSWRIALCGFEGDYHLPKWTLHRWARQKPGLGGSEKTRFDECIWFSPSCLKAKAGES